MGTLFYLEDSGLNNASAILRISGPDANTYLQGQFSQDVRVAVGGSAYGLWLDQKGKVLGDSHLIKRGDNDYLAVSFSLSAPELVQRLEAYLIADEVTLQDETKEWRIRLLWGEDAPGVPTGSGAGSFPSRRAGPSSREWIVPAGFPLELPANAVRSSRADAERERLKAAIPSVPADVGPRDLPQEAGLDRDAVSYTKGCYLGQEVMARIKNLGQVRRALHLVAGRGEPPALGATLYQGEQRVGEVRSGARDGDEFLAMAMLSLVAWQPAADLAVEPGGTASCKVVRRV